MPLEATLIKICRAEPATPEAGRVARTLGRGGTA